MRHSIRNLFLAAAAALLATSCGTYKGYVLMNDIEAPAEYKAPVRHDLTIKKGDNLQIIVTHKEHASIILVEILSDNQFFL